MVRESDEISRRPGFLPLWIGLAGFCVLWEILLLAQNPGLMADDSGEMAAAAYGLGLPHPPGYPLFDLLGHLICRLPVGTVAFRLNLFSGLLALLSLVFVFDSCRRIQIFGKEKGFWDRSLLVVMGIVFLSSRNLFAQCLTAKGCIYTLTLFLTSVVLWLYVVWNGNRGQNRFLLGALFIWGLGMANHWQTQVLWVPFLGVWVFQAKPWLNSRLILSAMAFIFPGLSLYLYLPLRTLQNCTPCWGYPIDLRLFYWVVSRQLVTGVEHPVQNLSFYWKSAQEMMAVGFAYWLPGLAVLALLGMFRLWGWNRPHFYGFLAMFVPVLFGILAVHEEQNIYLIPVYLVPLSGLALLLGAAGAQWVRELLPSKVLSAFWVLALGFVSVFWLAHVFKVENKSRYTLMEDFGTNALKNLDTGAILLADGDDYVMPIWYGLYVKRQRPDLIFEPSVFLYHGWGWKQLADQSKDLKSLIDSSNLFQERIEFLTRIYPGHPLFYALGPGYLKPAFQKVPGVWSPRGLAFAWEPSSLLKTEVMKRALRSVSAERQRGLDDTGSQNLDPSSAQIYRYYTEQLSYIPH